MELIGIVILLAFALGLMAYSLIPRKGEDRDALKRRLAGRRSVDEVAEIKAAARAKATQNIMKRATPMLSRLVMPASEEEMTQLRMKLASAGFRQRQAQTLFLAGKTIAALVGLIGGAATGVAMGYEMKTLLLAVLFGGGMGFMLPNFWLDSVANQRKGRVRRGLPDILDLLVVSVESGLALDTALKRVGEEMQEVHPDVSEEFRIATTESQMGIPRSEALDNMARRVQLDELKTLVSVITQAEKFGTSVAKALRNQGDAIRTKRRQQAEEKAQQTAVKLMIPLVLFIFPAMFVVLGGPAVIRMSSVFGNN